MLHKIKGFGYFGLQRQYNLAFNFPLLRIDAENGFRYIKIMGLFGFKWKTKPDSPLTSHDAFTINKITNSKQKKIVFVVNTIEEIGGVETRLIKLTQILKERGWIVVLFLERNDNDYLKNEYNFYFNFSKKEVQEQLINLLLQLRVDVVEFQFKSTKLFHDLHEQRLNDLFNVGACIHEECYFNAEKLNDVNYIVSSAKRKCLSSLDNYDIINNWGDFNSPVWNYAEQKKALIVSRIFDDKLQTIINFVDVCREYGVDYQIAGRFQGKRNKKAYEKLLKYGVSTDSFIGEIDTLRFLSENANEYLFIAGVGQVVIEAASLGYPTMIPPHCQNFRLSIFLKNENISVLREENFTIKHEKMSSFANSDVFFTNVALGKDLHDYIPFHSMQELVGNADVDKYLSIISNNAGK